MGKKKIVTKADSPEQVADTQVSATKKGSKRQVINGVAHIFVSYNNTIISLTGPKGEVIASASAGALGFKGAKKSTPYAANMVAKTVVEKSKRFNLTNVRIVVKGVGPGRESAIRGLAGTGLNITSIMDKTPIAHNGVRSPKPRRI